MSSATTSSGRQPGYRRPQRVAVVGAGMVGLSVAWFLQEHGVETVVLDRDGVAAGSSRGNAGWLTPSLVAPLPEPSVLRYGLRAMVSPASPVYVPPTADPRLLQFLVQFARNCTNARWGRAMGGLVPLNAGALAAFAELDDAGLGVSTRVAQPILAAYRDVSARAALVEELRHIEAAGQPVDHELLTGEQARSIEPALSDQVVAAIRLDGQRFLDPAAFVRALGEAVRRRGGEIRSGSTVRRIQDGPDGVRVVGERFDAVVVATGARLGELTRQVGVRRLVQAGRGYSFTVAVDEVPKGTAVLPGAAGGLHAGRGSASARRDDGVPAGRRSAGRTAGRGDRGSRGPAPARSGPR